MSAAHDVESAETLPIEFKMMQSHCSVIKFLEQPRQLETDAPKFILQGQLVNGRKKRFDAIGGQRPHGTQPYAAHGGAYVAGPK